MLLLRIRARNLLKKILPMIILDAVDSEVVIQTPGGEEIVSTNPQEPVESLSRVEGNEVYVIRKAANGRVGVD